MFDRVLNTSLFLVSYFKKETKIQSLFDIKLLDNVFVKKVVDLEFY